MGLGLLNKKNLFCTLWCSNVKDSIRLAVVPILGERLDTAGLLAISVFIHNHQKPGQQLPMDRKLVQNWGETYYRYFLDKSYISHYLNILGDL